MLFLNPIIKLFKSQSQKKIGIFYRFYFIFAFPKVNQCFYTNNINGIPSFLICKKFAIKLRKSKKGEENKRKMDFSKSLIIRK